MSRVADSGKSPIQEWGDTSSRWKALAERAIRLVLGGVLLAAAFLKGMALVTEPVAGTDLFTSRWFLVAVVEIELILGLWLVSGVFALASWRVALVCFTGFAGVAIYRVVAGYDSCGCFGKVQVSPIYTMVFDIAAVALLLFFRPTSQRDQHLAFNSVRWMGLIVLAGAIGIPSGIAMARYEPAMLSEEGDLIGDGAFVVLEPDTWIGRPFPLHRYINVDARLMQGDWVAVLYHHDCSSCRIALPQYEKLARHWGSRPDMPRVLLVEMPPYATPRSDPVPADTACIRGRLSDTREWFVQTPAVIELTNGTVTAFPSNALSREGLVDVSVIH